MALHTKVYPNPRKYGSIVHIRPCRISIINSMVAAFKNSYGSHQAQARAHLEWYVPLRTYQTWPEFRLWNYSLICPEYTNAPGLLASACRAQAQLQMSTSSGLTRHVTGTVSAFFEGSRDLETACNLACNPMYDRGKRIQGQLQRLQVGL